MILYLPSIAHEGKKVILPVNLVLYLVLEFFFDFFFFIFTVLNGYGQLIWQIGPELKTNYIQLILKLQKVQNSLALKSTTYSFAKCPTI